MSKQPKRPRDANKLAKSIVDVATGETEGEEYPEHKDPAAVALGRKGGLKGGKARAAALTAEERSEIAKKAAKARWMNEPKKGDEMIEIWTKELTKSDAQQDTQGSRMPFLRFTKGNIDEDHTTWFRDHFFSNLEWKKSYSGSGFEKEEALIELHVKLADVDLGVRKMKIDHDPARKGNHRAPTTHLHYDEKTRQALESENFYKRSVIVERDDSGNFSLKIF